MLLSNARNNNQGFTLIETLTVIIIVGILSAIAAPSLLGMLNRNKVTTALDEVQGALREAQREAMRTGKKCTVYIVTPNKLTNTNPVAGSTSNGCLVTGDRTLPSGVVLATNLTSSEVKFSFRGNSNVTTAANVIAKIVIYSSDNSTSKKGCLAIANGIGIMRTGEYSGSTSSATDITNGTCTTP